MGAGSSGVGGSVVQAGGFCRMAKLLTPLPNTATEAISEEKIILPYNSVFGICPAPGGPRRCITGQAADITGAGTLATTQPLPLSSRGTTADKAQAGSVGHCPADAAFMLTMSAGTCVSRGTVPILRSAFAPYRSWLADMAAAQSPQLVPCAVGAVT
ncbi:hypothetical protein HYQ46_008121 [Verticillium longisporum]|nr:hypothetical protein HYQ46_008121 [Verticillium longisporum]